jgi:alpha-tubulin suppressor-like RCC1 family protein
MKVIARNCLVILMGALLAALLLACGSKSTILTSTTAPSVFYSHSVAFRNHTTFTWGVNTYGQLGNGDSTGAGKFVPVPVATGSTGVSAGGTHTLDLKSDTTIWSWGNNGFGQLGNNTTAATSTPVHVSNSLGVLSGVTAISAGGSFSLALDSSNQVWAWGDNEFGQLGDTTNTIRLNAVQVQSTTTGSPLAQVTMIAAGGGHALALANGVVKSWGYNAFGQLGQRSNTAFGNRSTSTNMNVPGNVVLNSSDLSNVTGIAAGGSHSLFLLADGTVWACGYNHDGQLGDGTTTNRRLGVVQVMQDSTNHIPLQNVLQIAAGLDHSLAIVNDGTGITGTVWAWGYNFYGQLGNPLFNNTTTFNTTKPVKEPVQVMVDANNALTGVTKIVAIGNHSLALKNDGTLWAWGDNTYGQLGIAANNTTNQSYATQVTTLSGCNLY